jgi:hypothetical protein
MKKFEYKLIKPTFNRRSGDDAVRNEIEQQLNALGQEGWEIVAVNDDFEYVLKREI